MFTEYDIHNPLKRYALKMSHAHLHNDIISTLFLVYMIIKEFYNFVAFLYYFEVDRRMGRKCDIL